MHELDLYGVLLPPILVWALIAFGIRALLRRLLGRLGFYQFVAHPALFDIAVFIIVLGGLAALSARLALT
jgi:protein AaeX